MTHLSPFFHSHCSMARRDDNRFCTFKIQKRRVTNAKVRFFEHNIAQVSIDCFHNFTCKIYLSCKWVTYVWLLVWLHWRTMRRRPRRWFSANNWSLLKRKLGRKIIQIFFQFYFRTIETVKNALTFETNCISDEEKQTKSVSKFASQKKKKIVIGQTRVKIYGRVMIACGFGNRSSLWCLQTRPGQWPRNGFIRWSRMDPYHKL